MKISRIIKYIGISIRVPITRVDEAIGIRLPNQLIDTWGTRVVIGCCGETRETPRRIFVCVNYCIFIALYSLLLLFGDTIMCKSIYQTSEAQSRPIIWVAARESIRRG